jgi:hypothetical protein
VKAGFYSWEKLNNLELLDWKHCKLNCFMQYIETLSVCVCVCPYSCHCFATLQMRILQGSLFF